MSRVSKEGGYRYPPPDFESVQFRELRQKLADLFPKPEDIEILMFDSGVISSRIDLSGASEVLWHRVLREAARQHRLSHLLEEANLRYPAEVGPFLKHRRGSVLLHRLFFTIRIFR